MYNCYLKRHAAPAVNSDILYYRRLVYLAFFESVNSHEWPISRVEARRRIARPGGTRDRRQRCRLPYPEWSWRYLGRPGDSSANQKDAKYMQDFFSSVEIVKQNILAIRQATKRVSELNQEVVQFNFSSLLNYLPFLGGVGDDFRTRASLFVWVDAYCQWYE